MATNITSAMRAAAEKRHTAFMDRLGKKLAQEMGPVHVTGGERSEAVVNAFNEAMAQKRKRAVN